MKTKPFVGLLLVLCLLLAGCAEKNGGEAPSAPTEPAQNTSATEQQTEQTAADPTDAPAEIAEYPAFDFGSKTVTLNSGYEMPILGLGMFSLSDSQAENSTYWALKAGFRLIDAARIYGNEAAVGRGLRRAIDEGIVTREEVFITTKISSSFSKNVS